jgi:hypothetical protein
MLAASWVVVTPIVSVAVIAVMIGASIAASLVATRRERRIRGTQQGAATR